MGRVGGEEIPLLHRRGPVSAELLRWWLLKTGLWCPKRLWARLAAWFADSGSARAVLAPGPEGEERARACVRALTTHGVRTLPLT